MRAFPRGLGLALACAILARAFDPGKADFQVRYKEEISPYRINAVFLMPGEVLRLDIPEADSGRFQFEFDAGRGGIDTTGRLMRSGPRSWKWKAPDTTGFSQLRLIREPGGDTVGFNAFTMVPAAEMKGEYLRGYRIGEYPPLPAGKTGFYRPPPGFVKLDAVSAQAMVSPHFRLGQFACKQSADLPAYLVLKERLLLKLEILLETANDAGFACDTFHIMSGYRTPFYNRLLGNVKLSAHQFGGAADIFIDADPEDGEMDDLNGDGKIDAADSDLLINLVDALSRNETFIPYLGGIGRYDRNQSHGPFVHVDVRGFRALW